MAKKTVNMWGWKLGYCTEILGSEPGPADPIQPPSRTFALFSPDSRSSPPPVSSFAVGRPPPRSSFRSRIDPPSSDWDLPFQLFRPLDPPLQSPSSDSTPPFHSPLQLIQSSPAFHPDHRLPVQPPIQPPPRNRQPAPLQVPLQLPHCPCCWATATILLLAAAS